MFLNMGVILLDDAGEPIPPLASYIAQRIPIKFLLGIRPLLESSCEQGFQDVSDSHDSDLPYWKNTQPHERNAYAFERLHALALEAGMTVVAMKLENHYAYPQFEMGGLTLHVKHEDNYRSIKEQVSKADYRLAMAGMNSGFGQLSLQIFGDPLKAPDAAYLVLFYADGSTKSSVGRIYFALPSAEGEIIETCDLAKAIAAHEPPAEEGPAIMDDDIPLPPKSPDAGNEATGTEK